MPDPNRQYKAKTKPPPKKLAMFKIRTVGRHLIPFQDTYHVILTMPWWTFFVATFVAFCLINCLFASVFMSLPAGDVMNMAAGSFEAAFFFSVQTFATIGYGIMAPASRAAHLVVTLESFVGIISTALITGVTFAKFSRPTSRILFSDKMIVAPRNGVPHLMFRMANWRGNQVVEANLSVIVLISEKTKEGNTLRTPLELPLIRSRNSTFILTWLAMHRIDEASPFFGPDALSKLKNQNAEIFITFSGIDETMGQTINSRHRYELDDIVWNAHFTDVVRVEPNGTRIIDYRYFHDVEPVAAEHLIAAPPPSQPV